MYSAYADAVADGGRGLCVFGGLCRHVTTGTPIVIFCCLTVFDDWYNVGILLVPTVYQSSKTVKQ